MIEPRHQTVVLQRGDTLALVFAWFDDAGLAMDLTGCLARLQARNSHGDVVLACSTQDGSLLVQPDVEDRDTAGQVFLSVAPAMTQNLAPGRYATDLELTFPDGDVRSTPMFWLFVDADQTR